MKIISLGFAARVGKDTVAEYLVRKYSFAQESFAGPLKEFIGRHICGLSDKQLYGSMKEVVDQEWGMTPRSMLQLVGTDGLRNTVHKDFWVIPMRRKINEHMRNNRSVVISDVRFLNETELIKNLGGVVIRIDRLAADKISGVEKHSSEVELGSYKDWDYVIDNNGSLDDLYVRIDELMKGF